MKATIKNYTDDELLIINPLFKQAVYLVEATDFEYFALWGDHAENSAYRHPVHKVLDWSDDRRSYQARVGTMDAGGDQDIVIDIRAATINGAAVLFWHPVGDIVHHGVIDRWWKHHWPVYRHGIYAQTNPMNFSHVIDYISKDKPNE